MAGNQVHPAPETACARRVSVLQSGMLSSSRAAGSMTTGRQSTTGTDSAARVEPAAAYAAKVPAARTRKAPKAKPLRYGDIVTLSNVRNPTPDPPPKQTPPRQCAHTVPRVRGAGSGVFGQEVTSMPERVAC